VVHASFIGMHAGPKKMGIASGALRLNIMMLGAISDLIASGSGACD
jgi:hypothetical protein